MALAITRKNGQSFDCIWPSGAKRTVKMLDAQTGLVSVDGGPAQLLPLDLEVPFHPHVARLLKGRRNGPNGWSVPIDAPKCVAIKPDDIRNPVPK